MGRLTNDVWDRPDIIPESPCIKICTISSLTGFCEGCFRSLREVRDWEENTNSEKELILENCKKRKKISQHK